MPSRKNTKYNKKSKRLTQKRNKKKKTQKKQNRIIIPVLYGHIYSDMCGHCVAMQEEWNKLTLSVKNIILLDIGDNYEENVNQINTQYGTDLKYEGFPTIFKLKKKNGPIEYYKNERKAVNMKKWLYAK
uniref:Thioredoxin domain-containing protein n=1 Tax=viral metagenome TaxID=1070528 RepID=A0A6C0CNJ7_9ZZZZ